jgi:protein arginine N-methyltransferase 5
MMTCPITTPHFYSRVTELVSSYYQLDLYASHEPENGMADPVIPALGPEDSPLTPTDNISQLISLSSSWIDLASADPVIANVSRQAFNLEIAYASFCGISQVLVPGPVMPDGTISLGGVTQFARSILEAVTMSPYLRVHILLPMVPIKRRNKVMLSTLSAHKDGHLSSLATQKNNDSIESQDTWASWEAWNAIQSLCNYSSRVSVGAYGRVYCLVNVPTSDS